MKNHPFTLEPYKGMNSRYKCPNCHKERSFTRYIDSATGEHVDPTVGRCNRENNCGYHYTPRQYFHDNNLPATPQIAIAKIESNAPMEKPVSFIPLKKFKASLQKHDNNHFIQYLVSLFGTDITSELIGRYFIGTSKHWEGATIFWQIDITGKIRSGKVMLYDPVTGKRVKEPYSHITWVHKLLKQDEFVLKQCFFGEHLLKDETTPVAIAESEKTAIIASVYLPRFIWIAVGSLNNLNAGMCEVLSGRTVILFPDLNGFEKWKSKSEDLSNLALFIVSDLLERKASKEEKEKGLDLADYLIRYDHKEFAILEPGFSLLPCPPTITAFNNEDQCTFIKLNNTKEQNESLSEGWNHEIEELESYFNQITLPDHPIKLHPWTTIEDASLFIRSHFETVKANNGNITFLPYLQRLQELKQLLD